MDKKKQDFLTFISKNDFGMDTWMTIHNFHINSINIINTIEIYGILITKLDTDRDSFLITSNEDNIVDLLRN